MREIRGTENRNRSNEGGGGDRFCDLLLSLYWTRGHHALHLCKGKAILLQTFCRPVGFRKVEASRFQKNWYMDMVSLSACYTGHRYPQENVSGTHSC
jgi:hypothetical protein